MRALRLGHAAGFPAAGRELQRTPAEAGLGCRERLLRLQSAGETPAGAAERRCAADLGCWGPGHTGRLHTLQRLQLCLLLRARIATASAETSAAERRQHGWAPKCQERRKPSSNSRQAATHHHDLYFVDHHSWQRMAVVVQPAAHPGMPQSAAWQAHTRVRWPPTLCTHRRGAGTFSLCCMKYKVGERQTARRGGARRQATCPVSTV